MLTILLTEDVTAGAEIGSTALSGSGTSADPYVYDFAGEDLDMGAFNIRGPGASLRFENLGSDSDGRSIRHGAGGGAIDVSGDQGGGSISIAADGNVLLHSIDTRGGSNGGDVFITGAGSVELSGVDVGGMSINTGGADAAGHVSLLVAGGVRLAGGVDASGGAGGQLLMLTPAGAPTIPLISIGGNILTSGANGNGSDVRLTATAIDLFGSIETQGVVNGGHALIDGLRMIQGEVIDTHGGMIGGEVFITGAGSVELSGVDVGGMSINTGGADAAGHVTLRTADGVSSAGGIDASGGVGGQLLVLTPAGAPDIPLISVGGRILTSGTSGDGSDVRLTATAIDIFGSIETQGVVHGGHALIDGLRTIQGGVIDAHGGVTGGEIFLTSVGGVQLSDVDATGMSINSSGADAAGPVTMLVGDDVILAGGIDARGAVGAQVWMLTPPEVLIIPLISIGGDIRSSSFDANGQPVLLSANLVDVQGTIDAHGATGNGEVGIFSQTNASVGPIDLDRVDTLTFLVEGDTFVAGELAGFDTATNAQIDALGPVFYDSTHAGNAYLDGLTYTLPSGGVLTPENIPPVAADDAVTTNEDFAVLVDVLANDSDSDEDPLSVTAVSDPAFGTTTRNSNGIIEYVPNADFHGIDEFSYTIEDGAGGLATANVTVTVLSATQQLESVLEIVAELGLNQGNTNALSVKLLAAISSFERDSMTSGVNQLQAFINQVSAFTSTGRLSQNQADMLVASANAAAHSTLTAASDAPSSGALLQELPDDASGQIADVAFAELEEDLELDTLLNMLVRGHSRQEKRSCKSTL